MNWMVRSLIFSILLVAKIHSNAQVLFPNSAKEWLNQVYYTNSIITDKINGHVFYDPHAYGEQSFRWSEPEVRLLHNTASPFNINDGTSWRGKGLAIELLAGFQFRKKHLKLTLAPIFYFSQNSTFQNSQIISQTKSKWNYQAIQGYTNNGQMLGTWIGPGSRIHSLKLSYLMKKDFIKLDMQRVQMNDDYFIETLGSNLPKNLIQRNKELRYSNINILLSAYKNTERFGDCIRLVGNIYLNKYYELKNDFAESLKYHKSLNLI